MKTPHSKLFRNICLLFLLSCGLHVSAQDTDSKDEKTTIIVYIQLKTQSSPCLSCYDSLASKIKKVEFAKEVKAYFSKSLVTFQLPSSNLINEQLLMKMTEDSGLIPVDVKFNKEQPETDEKPILF